ncbi:hypothetical protein QEZ54_01745 [Catellatospora sp. KI3]|uniref:hypothetical protein n=1 Tax=Catellatospora sp. KI3 TaxID=3041620 RepID=UPI00248297E5|nr:hypothetical protein [Catellatospora sp. KI3]MDI1459681.1 hypothetical protein [Catellatospora sp. KI3]
MLKMRKAIAPMLLVLVTVLGAGCEPRGNDDASATKPVHCTVVADGPKKNEETGKVSGQVRYRCATPGAERLTLKIRIEKRQGDSDKWSTVATKTYTLKGKQTYAPELKYEARDVTMSCREGSYRTVVDWSRTSRKDTEGDNLISGAVKDPCKPKIFD